MAANSWRCAGAFAALVLAGGCQSMAIVNDYNWVKQQDFQSGGISWVVLDIPKESRLMLRPSIGDDAAAGQLAKDLGVASKVDGWETTISAWFKSRGRNCSVTKTDVITATWRQFHYHCI